MYTNVVEDMVPFTSGVGLAVGIGVGTAVGDAVGRPDVVGEGNVGEVVGCGDGDLVELVPRYALHLSSRGSLQKREEHVSRLLDGKSTTELVLPYLATTDPAAC